MKRPILEIFSWVAGIASAILGVVALFASISLQKPETPKKPELGISQQAGDNSPSTFIGSVTGNVTFYPQPSIQNTNSNDTETTISGRYSSEKAWSIAYKIVKEYTRANLGLICNDAKSCNPIHKKVGEYNLIYPNKESIILITASIDATMICHACMPKISVFEFEKTERKWILIQHDIMAFEWGSWGEMDSSHVKTQVIGTTAFGIFFDIGYTSDSSQGAAAVWTKLSDEYRKILHIPNHYDDTGAFYTSESKWIAKISSKQTNAGLFDLIVFSEGTINNKKFKSTTTFSFDGVEYTSDSTPKHLMPIDCIKINENCFPDRLEDIYNTHPRPMPLN